MAFLIKGMDMPKHGSYLFTVRYDADGNLCVYPLVYMPGFDDRDMKRETPMFPLVGVPTPHGRLMDVDKFLDHYSDKAKNGRYTTLEPYLYGVTDVLKDLMATAEKEAIIEAEE